MISAAQYPAPAWSVQAILAGPTKQTLDAVGDGPRHTFKETAVATGSWAAGTYAVSIRATNGDDVFEIEAGSIEVKPDMAALDAGHDARTHARKVLDAIEAVIEQRATKDQMGYSIGGRSLQRTPIADLIKLRTQYRAEVNRQKPGGGKRAGRSIKVRFV